MRFFNRMGGERTFAAVGTDGRFTQLLTLHSRGRRLASNALPALKTPFVSQSDAAVQFPKCGNLCASQKSTLDDARSEPLAGILST
tara:strand:- start:18286 stop:18543 length:258 start_codon:yes stop_codon:yes gene_type:complete